MNNLIRTATTLGLCALLAGTAQQTIAQSIFDGTRASFDLSELDGTQGFVINGINDNDSFGSAVSGAGDVNGDGIDDMLFGSQSSAPNGMQSGQSYIVYGRDKNFPDVFELSDLDGTNGFMINGIDQADRSGASVSGADDFNGDGLDDFLIGAWGAYGNDFLSGESYIIFGSSTGYNSPFELSNLDGSNGVIFRGNNIDDRSGISLSLAGDINNDGFDDIIIGAPLADPNGLDSGQSYVVFGSSDKFQSPFDLSSLNGSNGFTINGFAEDDLTGRRVSGAGDIDVDGYEDILIGSIRADQVCFIPGSPNGFPAIIDFNDTEAFNGTLFKAIEPDIFTGYTVARAGDINGDGLDDMLFGAPNSDANGQDSGQCYVVLGSPDGFPPTFNLSELDGTNGFIIDGNTNSNLGRHISTAGDVNGDGLDDLILGGVHESEYRNNQAGEVYVIFGSLTGFRSPFKISDIDGSNGIIIQGVDSVGFATINVSGTGDINADGADDILIGAQESDPNGVENAGTAWVIYGKVAEDFPPDQEFTITLSATADITIHDVDNSLPIADQTLADGMGGGLFAGKTLGLFGNILGHRSAIEFSFDSIPPGSRIENVSLTMLANRKGAANTWDFSLHRALTDWNEGPSVTEPNEGRGNGAAPLPGDSTWFHRNFNTEFWNFPGGDFLPNATATTTSDGSIGPEVITWDSPEMVQDVQDWLNNPGNNFGWFLLGDETTEGSGSVYRFGSRSYFLEDFRPSLTVIFTPPVPPVPECAD